MAKIIPIHPDQLGETPDAGTPASERPTYPSRRLLGGKFPSRRTLGKRGPTG